MGTLPVDDRSLSAPGNNKTLASARRVEPLPWASPHAELSEKRLTGELNEDDPSSIRAGRLPEPLRKVLSLSDAPLSSRDSILVILNDRKTCREERGLSKKKKNERGKSEPVASCITKDQFHSSTTGCINLRRLCRQLSSQANVVPRKSLLHVCKFWQQYLNCNEEVSSQEQRRFSTATEEE